MYLQQLSQHKLELHKGESKHKSLQEVEASFLDMLKIELFFLDALVGVVLTASSLATLLVSSSQCLHMVSILASKLL